MELVWLPSFQFRWEKWDDETQQDIRLGPSLLSALPHIMFSNVHYHLTVFVCRIPPRGIPWFLGSHRKGIRIICNDSDRNANMLKCKLVAFQVVGYYIIGHESCGSIKWNSNISSPHIPTPPTRSCSQTRVNCPLPIHERPSCRRPNSFLSNNVCRWGFFLFPSDEDATLQISNPTPSVHQTLRSVFCCCFAPTKRDSAKSLNNVKPQRQVKHAHHAFLPNLKRAKNIKNDYTTFQTHNEIHEILWTHTENKKTYTKWKGKRPKANVSSHDVGVRPSCPRVLTMQCWKSPDPIHSVHQTQCCSCFARFS